MRLAPANLPCRGWCAYNQRVALVLSDGSVGGTHDSHENKSAITPELEAEFLAAVQQAMSSKRDPEAMRRAAERMDRMREETYRQHGLLDIGVPAIRELRGDLPE